MIHAYTPATEPWEDWADLDETLGCTNFSTTSIRAPLVADGCSLVLFPNVDEPVSQSWRPTSLRDRSSSEYKKKKEEARAFLYSAVAKQVPDLEEPWLQFARVSNQLGIFGTTLLPGPGGAGAGGHAAHASKIPAKASGYLWTATLGACAEV